MFSVSESHSELQIAGPRDLAWRSASSTHHETLREAISIAQNGHFKEAITKAEDLWIAKHKDMHGVRFRVRVETTTCHAHDAASASEKY